MRRAILVGLVGLCFLPSHVAADTVDIKLGADDLASLYIDGDSVANVNDWGGGSDIISLDLTPGWHDIFLSFVNRAGSSWLNLSWKKPHETDWTIIPKENFSSEDASGNTINGLRADYFAVEQNGNSIPGFTIYGEGPIDHVHAATGYAKYEGREGDVWADGRFTTGWETFNEDLSGQILVEEVPAPSSTIALIGLGVMGLIGAVQRKRKHS